MEAILKKVFWGKGFVHMATQRLTQQEAQLVLRVVNILGLCTGISIGGVLFLAALGRTAPESLITIGGACVGSLGSLLVGTLRPSPSNSDSGMKE